MEHDRLRLINVDVADFRKSEATNFFEWQAKNKALSGSMKPEDVVLFLNTSMDQLVFVYGYRQLKDGRGHDHGLVASRRLRLINGRWSEAMIADYAEMVGIRLVGLKTLQERLAEQREALRAARRVNVMEPP